MINAFISAAITVQFNTPPDRSGSDQAAELFQVTGYDSLGNQYVYDKANLGRDTVTLTFPRASDALLGQLLAFAGDTVRGQKTPFTWYDHQGAAHTVRLAGEEIRHTRTGPNRHRVEITLEEDIPWSAPAAASFAAAKDSKTGVAPVWILKLTVNGTAYHLSDSALTITGWAGQTVTTLPWVAAWGQVRESVTGDLNEIRIAEFGVDCVNDPAASPNLIGLATSYPLEQSAAELYLWFLGLNAATDPPQMRFRGYVRDVEIPDETAVHLELEDEASRLNNYIGNRVSTLIYPNADPDDVGKVIPIVVGTVQKGAARAVDAGVMTSLPGSISISATSVILSSAAGLSAGKDIQVDDEVLRITAVAGDTVTVTRGYGGTLAASHLKGAMVWEKKSTVAYLAADHALDNIPKAYGRLGEAVLDITAVASRYLGSGTTGTVGAGQVGGQHPSYPGKACVTVPGYVTASQMVSLLVNDGIAVNDAIAIVDGIGVSDGIAISDTIAVSEAAHNHPVASRYKSVNPVIVTSSSYFSNLERALDGVHTTATYAQPQIGTAWSITFAVGKISNAYGKPLKLRWEFITNGWTGVNSSNWSEMNAYVDLAPANQNWDYIQGRTLTISAASAGSADTFLLYEVSLVVYVDDTTTDVAAVLTKTGNALRSGAVTKTGAASKSGTVSKTGTVTLSGNSVANTLVADELLVDKVRNTTLPADVVGNLLTTYCNDNTLQTVGAFPGSYAFNGEITEYKRAIDWLDSLGFQCRAYYRRINGISYLIVRPDAPASNKTLAACAITSEGVKSYRRRKVPLSQVINKISILFDRDWSQDRSDTAYRGISSGTNAASITAHGERESPSLFQFDFVTSQAMADSLRDFYLGQYGPRRWLHEFRTYLDHSELKFADAITLGFNGNVVGEIQEAGISPGSSKEIDAVELVVKA